jgi:hypothetical protein
MARSSTNPIPLARSERLVLGLFIAAVFLSALLLFGVQPMFSRMVLPQLGGSPSVWSVAMVFFQSMLLAGYAYAHFLMDTQNRRLAVAIHLVVLCGALLMLPLSIADWGAPPASGTAFWLLGLFTVSIGLPFFALAANNPLLQTWFVHTGHREAHDPYFLYAASNIGSFLALLSYPLLLEPAFTLHTQGWMWSGGFVLLVALIGGCGVVMLRSGANAAVGHVKSAAAKPDRLLLGRWVFLSTVPSGLLVAVTAHISTELTSAPLLWVMPLSLYLLTWVLVFQRRPALSHELVLRLQPFAVAGIVALLYLGHRVPMVASLLGHLLAFFIIALGCHGELARTRPAPAYLSSFYVALSFGGMLGGLFAGLLSPYIFSWIAEYPILVALAVLCRPWTARRRNDIWFWVAALGTGAFVIFAFLPVNGTGATVRQLDMAVLSLAALSVLFMRDARKSAVIVVLALIVAHTQHTGQTSIRSFFGVNIVFDTYDKRFRILQHGSTIHGAEELVDGRPVPGRPKPLTYYHDGGPITKAIEAVRARKAGPMRVAVIGLGAGALACRIMPSETWRFFEIDPTVIDIARDPKYFTFLSKCAPDLPVVLGDARLTMAEEPAGFYDVIVVDAYSSDAVPVHLATREAMAIYKSRLAPHGVVVMHISNRHLDLESVATGIAAANGMQTWLWNDPKFGTNIAELTSPSHVAVAAERADDVGTIATSERWTLTASDPGQRVWTDDYSNIAGAFWRKLRRGWTQR